MSLRDKIELPLPKYCLLSQAVVWIAKFETPISYEYYVTLKSWIKLDDEIYDEPKKALFLALTSGRIQAIGDYEKVDSASIFSHAPQRHNDWKEFLEHNPPGEIKKSLRIDPILWEWSLLDWNAYRLDSPYGLDVAAIFRTVSVSTKELFEIFPAPAEEKRQEADTSNLSRPGPKPKYDWNAFYAEIAVRADLDGLPETAADLSRKMAEWCMNEWGENGVPGETMLKEKISPIYKHPHKVGGR